MPMPVLPMAVIAPVLVTLPVIVPGEVAPALVMFPTRMPKALPPGELAMSAGVGNGAGDDAVAEDLDTMG